MSASEKASVETEFRSSRKRSMFCPDGENKTEMYMSKEYT